MTTSRQLLKKTMVSKRHLDRQAAQVSGPRFEAWTIQPFQTMNPTSKTC